MSNFKKRFLFGIILFSIFIACDISWANSDQNTLPFDIGGTSINFFEKIVDREFVSGENLIPNGTFEEIDLKTGKPKSWDNNFTIHTYDKEQNNQLRSALEPVMKREISHDNQSEGKNFIHISTPAEVSKIRGGKDPLISNYCSISIPLPKSKEPAKYLLTFKYRGKIIKDIPGVNYIAVGLDFFDGAEKISQRKKTRKTILEQLQPSGKWKDGKIILLAPEGTEYLSIYARLYGCGEADFDNIQMHKIAADSGVTVRLMPFSFLDNLFCLSSGNPGILSLSCRNEKDVKINKPFVYLELPEKIELVEARMPMNIERKKEILNDGKIYIQYKINVANLKHKFEKYNYGVYNTVACLLYTEIPAGNNYQGKYWFEDGSYKTTPETFNIRILHGIKGKTPQLFRNAAMFGRHADFESDRGVELLSDFYKNAGFNAVHINGGPVKMLKAFRKKGITRYTEPSWLANGYRLGTGIKPDNVKFQMPDGSYCKDSFANPESPEAFAICPFEVYTEGKYFRDNIVKPLRKILVEDRASDNIMPNWEPFMFTFKGCFCPNCKKEFIKYSGISENETDKLWPMDIIKKYRDKWIRFRSWQHAKLVETLEKNINALGKEAGIESHFIPEIAYGSLIGKSNLRSQTIGSYDQYSPLDYLDKLPVIEPWGPYVTSPFLKPYVYNTGVHLATYAAAKEVKSFVAEKVKDPMKRPKLIAFPHSYQLYDWVTEAESISFEYLCFFLNQWQGVFTYHFPRGYDARYWNALAQANTLIAENENFVFKGKLFDGFSVKAETPLPEFNLRTRIECEYEADPLYSLKNNRTLIQSVGYELDGKRMIAVGNFWEKGDAFVRLSVPGLPANQKYVLRQEQYNCCLAHEKGNAALSAEELQNGMLVHVGALRFSFFVVEPYKEGVNYGRAICPSEMNAFLNKRLPEIKNAIKFEDEYQIKTAQQTAEKPPIPDYSQKLKDITQGNLSCKAEKSEGSLSICAAISNGVQKLIIDPANGGRVKSWKYKNTELISQYPELGLALDSFWWPKQIAATITTPYEIDREEISNETLTLAMSRKLSASDSKGLDGATITKTYKVSGKTGELEVSSEIKNTTEDNIEFSFRYHNMMSFLEIRDGAGGWALMKNGNNPLKFERIFTIRLYRFAKEADKNLENAFGLNNTLSVTDGSVSFKAPWMPFGVSVDIKNKDDLHGFIFWDSGNQKSASFEPLFKVIQLAPGESWTAGMLMKVIDKN